MPAIRRPIASRGAASGVVAQAVARLTQGRWVVVPLAPVPLAAAMAAADAVEQPPTALIAAAAGATASIAAVAGFAAVAFLAAAALAAHAIARAVVFAERQRAAPAAALGTTIAA